MKKKDLSLKEILNENNFPYIKDYKVFRTLGLKLLDRCVLSEILSYNINGMEYAGSFEYICKEFNVTSKTALKALNNLIKAGYITKTASKGRKTSVYSINEDVLKQIFLNSSKSEQLNNPNYGKIPQLNNPNYGEIPQLNTSTMEKFHSKQCKNSTVNYGKIPHNNKYNNNNYNNIYAQSEIDADTTLSKSVDDNTSKQKKSPSNKKNDEIYIQRFDKFWEIYPKKKDKAKARKKWLKLKPDDEMFNKIITAVKEQAQSDQWQKDDGQYIPYPSTWLNGERWNDEIKKAVHITPPPKEEEYKPVGNFKPIY